MKTRLISYEVTRIGKKEYRKHKSVAKRILSILGLIEKTNW